MKIRVKKLGYYNHKRRQPGEVIILRNEKEFSALWMEKVDADYKPGKGKKKEVETAIEEEYATGDAEVI